MFGKHIKGCGIQRSVVFRTYWCTNISHFSRPDDFELSSNEHTKYLHLSSTLPEGANDGDVRAFCVFQVRRSISELARSLHTTAYRDYQEAWPVARSLSERGKRYRPESRRLRESFRRKLRAREVSGLFAIYLENGARLVWVTTLYLWATVTCLFPFSFKPPDDGKAAEGVPNKRLEM